MKKLIVILFVAVAIFSLTQWASADTVKTLGSWGAYQTGSGGEFALLPYNSPALSAFVSLYDSRTRDQVQTGTFQSFCLEVNEYINLNTTYTAVLNYKAINGGVGAAGDPISIGTAYLYYKFATGALSGYNYGANRDTTAGQLQNAIWYLEDEITNPGSNQFIDAVIAKFGSFANAQLDNNGTYGVKVLNLSSLDGCRAQDQLILTSVPEPITMLLLGLGLIGVAGIRRKFKS